MRYIIMTFIQSKYNVKIPLRIANLHFMSMLRNHAAQKSHSHTFLIDNHVRLHSSQNASYTEDVCDMHLRLTAKPHLCVICSTFHT